MTGLIYSMRTGVVFFVVDACKRQANTDKGAPDFSDHVEKVWNVK